MRKSNKPDVFPTRGELVEAGRKDLAEAVIAQGGWLSFGWDLDWKREKERESCDSNSGLVQENTVLSDENRTGDRKHGCHPDYLEVSISGRSM
jgi:hypothetical protein